MRDRDDLGTTFASEPSELGGGTLSETEEANYLLLVEAGAEVPGWLDVSKIERLDQHEDEFHDHFVARSATWLESHPSVNTVVVALGISSAEGMEQRVQSLGTKLVSALVGRARARLLFGAPSETPERQRRKLLGLAAQLAQHEEGPQPCIVGAHFAATPPSSSRIPIVPR